MACTHYDGVGAVIGSLALALQSDVVSGVFSGRHRAEGSAPPRPGAPGDLRADLPADLTSDLTGGAVERPPAGADREASVDGLLLALAVQSIGDELDRDVILRRTVDLCCALVGAEHAMLGLNDLDGAGDLDAMVTHGDPTLIGRGPTFALPLLVDGGVFGTLHLGGRPTEFGGRDAQTLSVLLQAAGAALGHVRVREQLVRDLQGAVLALRVGSPVDKLRAVVEEYAGVLGFRPELRFSEIGASLPDGMIADVLPVLQAALANVHAHAGATSVEVELDVSRSWVMLTITDDGRGLASGHAEGRGLTQMRERARRRGGVLRLGPNTPRGTAVSWLVPALS